MKQFIGLLLILSAYNAFSQLHISGTVTDINDNPLPGVQVYIEMLHIGTTTDDKGKFTLNHVPDSRHILTFSYLGFETLKKTIEMNGQNRELNIKLHEAVFHMDEVIVSTPFHKIQRQNVMKVNFKKISSLAKNGAPTLVQSMTSIPGVSNFATGTGIGKPVIRGLTGNRVLVYTQGVRLENQQFGGEHGLGLVDAGIESIEVIKGPASLLYGSDALGGVLYFNPERFALEGEANFNLVQRFFSNTLGSSTSAGYKNSKNRIKYLVRGTFNSHADYKIPDGNRVTNTRFNEKDFKAGLGWNTEKWAGEMRYNLTRSDLGLTEGIGEQNTSRTPELPKQAIDNHILSLHNHFYTGKSKFDVDLGYVQNNRKEFEDDTHTANLDLKLKTLSYNVRYHLPEFKNVEIVAGLQGMLQHNKNYGEELLIPDAKVNDVGLLTTALWTLNENNAFQGGIRFDYRAIQTERHIVYDDEGFEIIFDPVYRNFHNFTASIGYKTELFHRIITRINLASGFRAPNLAELTSNGVHEGTFRYEIGNPGLESEQNLQTDLSLEYKNQHLELYANGFYNRIDHYIFIEPTGESIDGYDVYRYTQSPAQLYGGEFGVHFHPHPLDWLHLESSYEMVYGIQDNGNYLPLIPANKWTNKLRTEFHQLGKLKESFVELRSGYHFAQNRVSQFEEPTGAYNLFDLAFGSTIGLKKGSIGLQFNINNLTNKTYIAHLSALKNDGIPNIGRNFVLGINLNL